MKKEPYENRYLVAYTKSSTRDIQVTNIIDPCNKCEGIECQNGECPTPNREWKDFAGQVILGFYRATSNLKAREKAATKEDCCILNLVAYELKQ